MSEALIRVSSLQGDVYPELHREADRVSLVLMFTLG